ncbi:unnamed protein product [Chondrus crispus]|uniref:Uncharacterized protein n=1 Tax=Chondrus crispus TaxID=2769 RepID=R7Q669_CHOCR|nr:unnamed protein product [Chondrus crispus]CDF32891.1 unnamed protein product [Chondrus crispus]|eukprot:XP_005712692.1 unnamed protein product [Chondrus crispus]
MHRIPAAAQVCDQHKDHGAQGPTVHHNPARRRDRVRHYGTSDEADDARAGLPGLPRRDHDQAVHGGRARVPGRDSDSGARGGEVREEVGRGDSAGRRRRQRERDVHGGRQRAQDRARERQGTVRDRGERHRAWRRAGGIPAREDDRRMLGGRRCRSRAEDANSCRGVAEAGAGVVWADPAFDVGRVAVEAGLCL